MDEKTLKLTAGWIYRNRHTGYWTYPILVAEISDRQEIRSLSLSQDDASEVFAALEKRGYMRKEGGEIAIGGASFQKYRIEYLALRELKKFSEIPFYYFLSESWIYYLEKYWAWFVVCIALIITSFLDGFVGKLGEWIGEKVTGK